MLGWFRSCLSHIATVRLIPLLWVASSPVNIVVWKEVYTLEDFHGDLDAYERGLWSQYDHPDTAMQETLRGLWLEYRGRSQKTKAAEDAQP